jgi:arylsulfatase A-like enzyme
MLQTGRNPVTGRTVHQLARLLDGFMTKKPLWCSAWQFLCLLFLIAATGLLSAAADARPNILLIFSDDHAYGAISAYGSKINKTPNIDRLAKEGMLFNRCYVGNSLCGPSRATILSGKYSHLNGFVRNGNKFDGTQPTFPKYMQKAGYQTAVIGKWHLETDPTGFDYWNILVGQGPYYNPPMIENGVRKPHTGYTTEIITDYTLDWLKNKRDKDKPFVMMYQHKSPHRNWQPAPAYFEHYKDTKFPEPATLFDNYSGRGKPERNQDMTIEKTMTPQDIKLVPPSNLTPEQLKTWNAFYEPQNEEFKKLDLKGEDLVRYKYQRYMKDYLRCVDAMDDQIGRVLNYLDESGLAKNTIVIYASDQGFYLGEHGWFDKRWIYEESVKTPFIVRWPGVTKPGTVNNDMISILDLPETFLDAAGLPVPADMQGRSLVPVLKGQTPKDWRTSWYYHYYEYPGAHSVRRHYGVVTDQYKLFHFYEKDVDEWRMMDLKKDPNELTDVYGKPEYAKIEAQLKAELARLRKELKVTDEDPPQADAKNDPDLQPKAKGKKGKAKE